VPERGNPQALNRYAYALNNPLRYTDPTGHDPLDADWESAFYAAHGRHPTDLDRQDRLFSLLFPGSGPNGTWSASDWARYGANPGAFIGNPDTWGQGGTVRGLRGFANLTSKLSNLYRFDETTLFVRAFALLFGGVAYDTDVLSAALGSLGGPQIHQQLNMGAAGFNPELREGVEDNPAHHYAGLFFAGYFFGENIGKWVGELRERLDIRAFRPVPQHAVTIQDIKLGNIAVEHGVRLRLGQSLGAYVPGTSLTVSHSDVATWIWQELGP